MLKKIKIETMGMVIMVVLLITVATLNVGTVNANTTDKKTSDLKWVTKYVPGFGNVTAREDMFVGEEGNVSIVMNNDSTGYGVITPVFEKHQQPRFIEVETPAGTVMVSSKTYNTLGKEKIISDQILFIEERNKLIKSGAFDTNKSELGLPIIPDQSTDSSDEMQPMAGGYNREDAGFYTRSGYYPTYVYGLITPQRSAYTIPDGITSYHELEVLLDGYKDACEFISEHRGSQRVVWVCLWNNNQIVQEPMPYFEQVSAPIEYYFEITSAGHYDIKLYNTGTGATYRVQYTDSTPSSYITLCDGSTELYYISPIPYFRTDSTIEQRLTKVGSTSYSPVTVYSFDGYSGEMRFVEISESSSNGRYITTHWAGSDVN